MIVLSCSQICKSFGETPILDGVSFSVNQGMRMGITGVNGSGKSTLLKLITGELEPDSGEIHKSAELSIGYLPQNTVSDSDKTIWEELLQVFIPLLDMEQKLKNMEKAMASISDMAQGDVDKLMDEYALLMDDFEKKGGYSYQSYMKGVLSGLGFSPSDYNRPLSQLSGGQKTRIALARLLLEKPDLLLLDEPTNHLDLESVQWLEGYLEEYPGTVIVISHDRYFLDRLCNMILEIENGKSNVFMCNYSDYKKQKQALILEQQKKYDLQQREIKRQQAIINRFRSYNREKSIRAAESRQKMLDRMEQIDKVQLPDRVRMSFEIKKQSGRDVLEVDSLSKSFGDNLLFENISFSLRRGDRVGIIGPNGCGKSTLFKIILGQIPASSGRIKLGKDVQIGYYEQEQSSLNPNSTIIEEITNANPHIPQTAIRNVLAGFLFKGDDVYKTVGSLSGGERGRVLLASLMLSQDNLLLLDEPTNHLDTHSREQLEESLSSYTGTIIAISHDRYFLNRIVNRILVFEGKGIVEYLGNYDYYIYKKTTDRLPSPPKSDSQKTRTALKEERRRERQERERLKREKQRIAGLEDEINQLEDRLSALESLLCDAALYEDIEKMKQTQLEYQEIKEMLDDAYNRWLRAMDGHVP